MTESLLTSSQYAEIAADAANERKAQDIVIMDMREALPVTDYFLVASGSSTTNVKAIADFIEEKLEEVGLKVSHKEGYREAHWILLDYGYFVAHIFVNEERQFYSLEQLWASVPSRVYKD